MEQHSKLVAAASTDINTHTRKKNVYVYIHTNIPAAIKAFNTVIIMGQTLPQ